MCFTELQTKSYYLQLLLSFNHMTKNEDDVGNLFLGFFSFWRKKFQWVFIFKLTQRTVSTGSSRLSAKWKQLIPKFGIYYDFETPVTWRYFSDGRSFQRYITDFTELFGDHAHWSKTLSNFTQNPLFSTKFPGRISAQRKKDDPERRDPDQSFSLSKSGAPPNLTRAPAVRGL